MTYSYAITQDLKWQSSAQWQTPDTPFMSFEYWQALHDTGAIGEASGWVPLYIIVYEGDEKEDIEVVAVMPLFIKGHHQGEYVFDHAWAEAYARYGIDYYPRLVTSVPYTPVTGQRFWLAKGVTLEADIWLTALTAVDEVAKQIGASSWHGLFISADQIEVGKPLLELSNISHASDDSHSVSPTDAPSTSEVLSASNVENSQFPQLPHQLLKREGYQFLWQNKNISNDGKPFTNFEEFLNTLTAKKRKNIRAERKKIPKQNLSCQLKTGDEITLHDWEVFYQCYAMTYAIRGRSPYLTSEFFKQIAQTMPNHLMLAQGVDATNTIVASSLFFYDDSASANATLYGRYWGSLAEFDSLHFELCYYQGIEFAIEQGLQYFDPGTQGEHKLIRGFVPTKTYSLHQIFDERFEPAIAEFCEQDLEHMRQYRLQAHESLPFNIDNMPAFKG